MLRSKLKTAEFYTRIKPIIERSSRRRRRCTARSPTCSASVCSSSGKSGIGKSECVLDLVERGHRLVADDLVIATRRGNDMLIGRGHELQRHHMEIRGVGLIDIPAIFGIRAVRQQKRIEVVVQLEEWDEDARSSTARGSTAQTTTILGVELPKVAIPLNPGKNITVDRRGHRDEPSAAVQRREQRRSVQPAAHRSACRPRSRRRFDSTSRKMMSEGAPVAIVAAHGDFAAGFVSAVEQITGRGDLFLPMTNAGLGAAEIEQALRERRRHAERPRDLHRPARREAARSPRAACSRDAAGRRARHRRESRRCCSTSCSHDELAPAEAASHAVDERCARSPRCPERRVAIELYRIDDRLIHGQVVVGWGQPLDLGFIVLVDDEVAGSEWEQELYRMGVPPEMDVLLRDAGGRGRARSTQ